MVSDTGLIVVSIISLAGMVLLFTLNNSTWFKKENFKIQKKNTMDANRLQIKKLEKDLGLQGATKPYQEPKSMLETGGNLLEVAKQLSPEQLTALAGKFLPEEEYDEQPPSLIEKALDFAQNNPEVAQQFLKGISGVKGDQKKEENVFN